MLSKKILLSTVIAAALFSPISYAASSKPDKDNTEITTEQRAERKEQRSEAQAERKAFFKEFKKSENELFEKIPELDKAEAEKVITEFYAKAFKDMPMRKKGRKNNSEVVEAIEGMDIPQDVKTKVISRINEVGSKHTEGMQEKAVAFATSLIDMTPEERENAINKHDKMMTKRFSRMSKKNGHRGMSKGMRGRKGHGNMQNKERRQGNRDDMQHGKHGNDRGCMQREGHENGRMYNNRNYDDSKPGCMQCPMMRMMHKMMQMNENEEGRNNCKFKNNNRHQRNRYEDHNNSDDEEEDHKTDEG